MEGLEKKLLPAIAVAAGISLTKTVIDELNSTRLADTDQSVVETTLHPLTSNG